MPFFIIFLLIPIIEIGVFMAVGDTIGIGTTLLLALFTAILGGAIIKRQGLQTLSAIQNNMRAGEVPMQDIFDGFCLLAAGATLITPGFVTDTIGFLLLIPPVRVALRHFLAKHMTVSSRFSASSFASGASQQHRPYNDPDILDGEYEDLSGEHPKDNSNPLPRIDKS